KRCYLAGTHRRGWLNSVSIRSIARWRSVGILARAWGEYESDARSADGLSFPGIRQRAVLWTNLPKMQRIFSNGSHRERPALPLLFDQSECDSVHNEEPTSVYR